MIAILRQALIHYHAHLIATAALSPDREKLLAMAERCQRIATVALPRLATLAKNDDTFAPL